MNFVDLIQKKKQGINYTEEEIKYIVSSVNSGLTDDSQLSALLMAVNFRGLNSEEILYLTKAVSDSSVNLDFSEINSNIVTSISSVGIGDNISLAILSLLAASGVSIIDISDKNSMCIQNSADKIESVPDVKSTLSELAIVNQIKNINAAIVSFDDKISYFENKLSYIMSLTGNSDSDVLVAITIISKLVISKTQYSLINIKYGAGTAIKTREDAARIALLVSNIAKSLDNHAITVVVSNDEPIGRSIGASLEVIEVIEFLKGNIDNNEFANLTYHIASLILLKFGICNSINEGYEYLKNIINSKKALKCFEDLLHNQGAKVDVIKNYDKFTLPCYKIECESKKRGFVQYIDASFINKAMYELGAVKSKLNGKIDYTVGIYLNKKSGEYVNKDDIIYTIYSNDYERTKRAQMLCDQAFVIGESKPSIRDVVYKVIGIEEEDV